MNKYILTFESYKSRKKKKSKKSKIWDELLQLKERPFKSVKEEPDAFVNDPNMAIPSPSEGVGWGYVVNLKDDDFEIAWDIGLDPSQVFSTAGKSVSASTNSDYIKPYRNNWSKKLNF